MQDLYIPTSILIWKYGLLSSIHRDTCQSQTEIYTTASNRTYKLNRWTAIYFVSGMALKKTEKLKKEGKGN